jgi:hypothetical protein
MAVLVSSSQPIAKGEEPRFLPLNSRWVKLKQLRNVAEYFDVGNTRRETLINGILAPAKPLSHRLSLGHRTS